MARMTASHKTQIIIALITVTGGIIVALLTSWDKFFPPEPASVVQANQAPVTDPAVPVVGDPAAAANELQRMQEAQAAFFNRSAGTIEDINRKIDAQSANLSGR